MGAGGKADPTRVHISDLRSASRKQLATAARQMLRMMAKKEAKDSGEKITNGSGVANGGWLSCVDDDSKLAVVFRIVEEICFVAITCLHRGLL
jgi:hypothetical protein